MGATACDVLIVGAGIAGASAAYFMGPRARCILLEQEWQPGYHSTGRSAALFTETYGTAPTRALTTASRSFLEHPPEGFAPQALLTPRGVLLFGTAAQRDSLDRQLAGFQALVPTVRALDGARARALVPVLRPQACEHAILEPEAMDIDVNAVHRGYLRGAQAAGHRVVCDARVTGLERAGGLWRATTTAGLYEAPILVNAAGAWTDRVAALAGLAPLGVVPMRRTAFTFDAPAGTDASRWPMAIEADEAFYFKPDAGRILGSLAEETPTEPCDAQPEDLDVATAVDRIETATSLRVARLASKWAGLRSFVPDRTLVAGFDPATDGFLWLAGQGGYGIQTSPAMGRIAAGLVTGTGFPDSVTAFGVSAADLAPGRFRGG